MEFTHEDQIYNLLDSHNKPLFLFYYVPGEKYGILFREKFLKAAAKYNE